MFKMLLKMGVIGGLTFVVLSLNFQNKPLFSHIYPLTSEFSQNMLKKSQQVLAQSWAQSKHFLSRVFLNASPQHSSKNKKSAEKIGETKSEVSFGESLKQKVQALHVEYITDDEKAELEELILKKKTPKKSL
jgi:hypothetical protein